MKGSNQTAWKGQRKLLFPEGRREEVVWIKNELHESDACKYRRKSAIVEVTTLYLRIEDLYDM